MNRSSWTDWSLECADLMRARAQGAGQRLELLQVDPVSVRGNEALLKEALLELIENACRYGGDRASDQHLRPPCRRIRAASRGQPAWLGTAAPPMGRRVVSD